MVERDALQDYADRLNGQTTYRASQMDRRSPRVNLDKFYDTAFAAANIVVHPVDTLRNLSPRQQAAVGITTAAIVAAGAGLAYRETEYYELREGRAELTEIGRTDSKEATGEFHDKIPGSRAASYAEELPGYFSEEGIEALKKGALTARESETSKFQHNSEVGLDALIATAQLIDGHDLGDGKFLAFDDVAQQQLLDNVQRFADSGLASEDVKAVANRRDFTETLTAVQDLPSDMATARLALSQKINGKSITTVKPSPQQGFNR